MPITVLVVTCADDVHADALIAQAEQTRPDWTIIRLHPIDASTNWTFRIEFNASGNAHTNLQVLDSGRQVQYADIIWWRKPDNPNYHPSLTNASAQECSRQEYRELMHSLRGCFPTAIWVNDYWRMAQYSGKLNQIEIARANDFLIPETIITSRAQDLRAFAQRFPQVVAKPLYYSGFLHADQQYACWTNILSTDDLNHMTDLDLSMAPMMVQRRLRKALELRVTVIGEEVFPCAISTSHETIEGIDWRIRDVEQLPHRLVSVPDRVTVGLKSILRQMGLNFGAFDLILDEDGEYYFLEINPNGQFYWIELLTGAPLIEAMLRLMATLAERHEAQSLA